jgi:putative Ca2+/H+ antiporter (TMEM165/GDT1 family)
VASIDPAAALSTFALILPSELPDKTFVATLVLATRYRKGPVWIGVAAAFFVQCAIAVTLGGLLSLLPSRLVAAAAATLFAIGSIVLLRGGLESRRAAEAEAAEMLDEESQALDEVAARVGASGEGSTSTMRIAATSFLVLFVAEWGDLSQLLTAGQAARTGEPLSVFIGAWSALLVVSGLAVLAGSWLQQRIPLHRVRFVSAAILAVLTVVAISEVIRG